jgi:hypothetical protein
MTRLEAFNTRKCFLKREAHKRVEKFAVDPNCIRYGEGPKIKKRMVSPMEKGDRRLTVWCALKYHSGNKTLMTIIERSLLIFSMPKLNCV